MSRKSRIELAMATPPTAAHAAWRMKSRRVRNKCCRSSSLLGRGRIRLLLDGVVGGRDDQMNDRARTFAALRLGRSGQRIGDVPVACRGVRNPIVDGVLRCRAHLARGEERAQFTDQIAQIVIGWCRWIVVGPITRRSRPQSNPRTQVNREVAASTAE